MSGEYIFLGRIFHVEYFRAKRIYSVAPKSIISEEILQSDTI